MRHCETAPQFPAQWAMAPSCKGHGKPGRAVHPRGLWGSAVARSTVSSCPKAGSAVPGWVGSPEVSVVTLEFLLVGRVRRPFFLFLGTCQHRMGRIGGVRLRNRLDNYRFASWNCANNRRRGGEIKVFGRRAPSRWKRVRVDVSPGVFNRREASRRPWTKGRP